MSYEKIRAPESGMALGYLPIISSIYWFISENYHFYGHLVP